jgi:hypothetical protein
MPDPQLEFDREELSITLSGLGGGWSLGQLGELSLMDSAELHFPSTWNNYKTSVAMQVIEMQWRLSARVLLTQTLEGGVEFTRADGTGSSMALDNALLVHLLDRRTAQIDLKLKVSLDGSYHGGVFEGSGVLGLGLRARF